MTIEKKNAVNMEDNVSEKNRICRSPTVPIFITLHSYLHTHTNVIKIFDLLVSLTGKLGSMQGKIWGFSVWERREGEGILFRDKLREFYHCPSISILIMGKILQETGYFL